MISFFRSKAGRVVMFGILAVGLVAIVITGFGTGGMGGLTGSPTTATGSTMVSVGDREITDTELTTLIDGRYRQMVRQQPTLDRATFMDQSFAPLLDRIISDNALVAFGRSLGLTVSQAAVDRVIVGIPAFQGVSGQFEDDAFRRALAAQNITERQLRDDITNGQLMRMVALPVGSQVRVPQAVALQYASLLLEQRRGGLGAVPVDLIARSLNPTDQEVQAFYQANQRAFQIGERRVVRFAMLNREQLGDAARATDQEIQAYYQQHQAEYGPGETRNIQKIVFPDENAARQFAQRVQAGTGFQEAAQAAGFAPTDINFPNQTRAAFAATAGEEVAYAAFGAAQGALAGPVRTELGFQVVRVEAINRTPPRPLEQVRAEIVTAVEGTKAQQLIQAAAERIEDRLQDGASFEEVAQAERLQIQTTRPMLPNGAGAANDAYQFPAPLNPLLGPIFEMDADSDPQFEVLDPNGLAAIVQVQQIVPPAVPPFDQVRDQVRARMIQQTALQRARAIADGIVQRLNAGMAPAQAYAQSGLAGLPPPRELTLRRVQIAQAGQQVPPPLRILFSIPQGRARVVPAPNDGGWVIVHHIQQTAGDARGAPQGRQIMDSVQQGFAESAALEVQEQFGRAVLANQNVSRNEEGIAALRGRLRTGSTGAQ